MARATLTLDEIGLETGTDKSSIDHNYLSFYERFLEKLRDKPIRILEIGILDGASIKMWEQYFPNAVVIGADINPSVIRFETPRIKIEIIDQSNVQNLVDLGTRHGPFDIIVEDGSHLWEHQITSLRVLFPFLKDLGFYIVEDLQTNFGVMAEGYRGISKISCIEYLKRLVDLRVSTELTDISKEEDSFLRTYGRSIGFLAFHKHACLIEKSMEKQNGPPQLNNEPLVAVEPGVHPFQIFAHVGLLGDVRDNGSASLSLKPIKDCHIQGFGFWCSSGLQEQIKYRGRQANGSWTNWATGNSFTGSRGENLAFTGFSINVSGEIRERYNVFSIGAFTGGDLVRVGNGEDCLPKQDGVFLRGMQLVLRQK